jgi:hypothetical protein
MGRLGGETLSLLQGQLLDPADHWHFRGAGCFAQKAYLFAVEGHLQGHGEVGETAASTGSQSLGSLSAIHASTASESVSMSEGSGLVVIRNPFAASACG